MVCTTIDMFPEEFDPDDDLVEMEVFVEEVGEVVVMEEVGEVVEGEAVEGEVVEGDVEGEVGEEIVGEDEVEV